MTDVANQVGEGLVQRATTSALRERSIERLKDGFHRYVQAVSGESGWDPRDEMINMTPFIDCARRLGHDPALVLGPIAAGGAEWLRDTFDSFVVRPDISLATFGWSIVQTARGPAYHFAFPPD